MVKLNFLHICDNVIISNDGKVSLINIFNMIFSKTFPAVHPKFTIFCNMIGDDSSVGEHDIKISIFDSSKILTTEVSGKIDVKGPSYEANFIANFLNILFPREDNYLIEVKINGIKVNEKDYAIKTKKVS